MMVLLTTPKPLTVWITTKCETFLKRWDHLTCFLRNLYAGQEAAVRTRHGTTDCFQTRKGIHLGSMLSSAYLTYMWSTSWKMPGWMKHKLESRLLGDIAHYQRNANQNYNENNTSHWSEWPSSKSLQTINAGKGVEKREHSCTIGGNVN